MNEIPESSPLDDMGPEKKLEWFDNRPMRNLRDLLDYEVETVPSGQIDKEAISTRRPDSAASEDSRRSVRGRNIEREDANAVPSPGQASAADPIETPSSPVTHESTRTWPLGQASEERLASGPLRASVGAGLGATEHDISGRSQSSFWNNNLGDNSADAVALSEPVPPDLQDMAVSALPVVSPQAFGQACRTSQWEAPPSDLFW